MATNSEIERHSPLITLIIPTRERADTLTYTLETALAQEADDYEILVSDNCSQDHTRSVVESVSDRRIRYVNTGQRVSMCDNWEFALGHARGEYVIFIGDDDGVMPNAISELSTTMRANPCDTYKWAVHEYRWPMEDRLAVIENIAPQSAPSRHPLRPWAEFAMTWGGWRYARCPSVYHCAIRRRLLTQISETTGRTFHSTQPDVFTTYALPVFTDEVMNTGRTVTVAGHSAKSNGGALYRKDGHKKVTSKYIGEFGDYKLHPTLYPDVPPILNLMADTMLRSREMLPDYYAGLNFNYNAYWAYMMSVYKLFTPAELIRQRRDIRRYHDFDARKFLYYVGIHRAAQLRLKAKFLFHIRSFQKRTQAETENLRTVSDFVNAFAQAH